MGNRKKMVQKEKYKGLKFYDFTLVTEIHLNRLKEHLPCFQFKFDFINFCNSYLKILKTSITW